MPSRLLVPLLASGLALATPAVAQDASTPPATVILASDADLTCLQIGDEAAALSERMGGRPERGVLGEVGGVAKAGAAMLIPGAGLLIAGADALTADQRREREAAALAVQNRWFYLNGLYSGRRCDAPAAAAATPTPPAVTIQR